MTSPFPETRRPTCLGILTARGGSKGVVDKNIRDLCGKPTISYSIETALACPHIDRVVVTTDSPAIRDVAIKHGAEAPFLRPAELSGDLAQQEDAILHAMEWYESKVGAFERISLLDPTAPLRRVETLNRGFDLLNSRDDIDAVISVTECDFPPAMGGELPADGTLKGFVPDSIKWLNRQEMPDYYRTAGVICISGWAAFRRERSFITDTTAPLIIDGLDALDIDEPFDFFIVEQLIAQGLTTREALAERVNGGR